MKFHVVMFNLPLASPPLSRAAVEGERYDMSYIARRLAEVMEDVSGKQIVGKVLPACVAIWLTRVSKSKSGKVDVDPFVIPSTPVCVHVCV